MSTRNILAGALVAQVALAALTWWPRGHVAVEAKDLVTGGADAITALEIVGAADDAQAVKLDRKDGHWRLASEHDFPADDAKVAEVVDAIGKIKLKEPVATQASSLEALGVTDDEFERKVTVTTASGPITFLVGSAESKAIHLRPVGADDVYRIKGLSAWTLKDTAKGYLPATYVDLDKADVTALSVTNAHGTIALTKGESGWTLADGAAANPAQVDKLLGAVAPVRLAEIVGTDVTPEQGLTDGAVRVTWTAKTGDTSTQGGLVIGAEKASNRYVKADDSPFVVLASGYKLKDVIEADPAAIVGGPETIATADPGALGLEDLPTAP